MQVFVIDLNITKDKTEICNVNREFVMTIMEHNFIK